MSYDFQYCSINYNIILLNFRFDFLLLSNSMSCGPGRLRGRRLVKDTGKRWHETVTASGGELINWSRSLATVSPRPTERTCGPTWTVP